MSKGKFALGAIFGAAAGAIAALLTAPKSGKETRADLKKKADEVKKKAEATKKDLEGKAMATKKEWEGKAAELKDRADDAIKGAKDGFNKPSAK